MKKIIAVLLLAALVLSLAACGGKTPAGNETTEASTDAADAAAVTEPEVGRIGEKGTFYVYIPENWCKMEYTGDNTRLRLFAIPSAPKIEEGKTPEVEIKVNAETGVKADVSAAVSELLKIEGAKKGKDTKLDDETFKVVTYTDAREERQYTVYVGLGGGSLATVTLKGLEPTDEDAAAILRSVSFKSMEARSETSTTTKAGEKTNGTAKTPNKASGKTSAAAKTTAKAAEKTTAAAKATAKAAEKTTTAAKATAKAAEKTTAAAKTTTTKS